MALPYFTDSDKLGGEQFSSGLSPARPPSKDFVESVELSLYVDESGVVNVGGQLLTHIDTDPIDSVEVPSFNPDNKFVRGLSRAIGPMPVGGIILFPTYRFDRGSANPYRNDLLYPNHTPEGFVPCVGQVLQYKGGKTIRVPAIAPPTGIPAAYMMRVEPGWRTPDPSLPPGTSSYPLGSFLPNIYPLI